jgi:hypothetical protein
MAPVASAAAAFDGVEDEGEAVARRRWHLTPAAVVATAGREGSSVDVGGGRGGGGGGSGCGCGGGGDGAGGWCGRRWRQWR